MDTVVRWADTQWVGLPRRLMLRFPSLRGLAGDGHVVVTSPILAAALPAAVLLLGLVSGLLRLGYEEVYTESVVLLAVLVALGFFSSQLGVLVVVGFCVGDFLTAPRYEGTGYSRSIWFSGILGEGPLATVAHGWLPRLITYLLLVAGVILLPRAARAVVHTVGRARRMPALLAWGLASALLVVIAWLGTDAWVAAAPTLVRPLFTWGSYNGTPTVASVATLQETGGVVVAAAVIATVLRQLWLGAAMAPGIVQDRLRAAEDGEVGATPVEREAAALAEGGAADPETAADLLAKARLPTPSGVTRRVSGAVALSLLATLTLAGILEQLWLWFAAFGVLLAVRLLRTTPQDLPGLEHWRRVAARLPAWARLIVLWLLSRVVVEAISNDVIGSYTALGIFVLGSIVVVFVFFPGEPHRDDDSRLEPRDDEGGTGSGDEKATPGGAMSDGRRTDGTSSPDTEPGRGTASGTVQRAATGVVGIAPPQLLAPRWCRRLRVMQLAIATWTVAALVGLFTAAPAWADNCSVFADCFGVANSAAEAAFGLALLAALSMVLDFMPVIGTAKGVIEAMTGRDLLTGQELAWWERALGVVPMLAGLGGLGAAARVSRNVPRNLPLDDPLHMPALVRQSKQHGLTEQQLLKILDEAQRARKKGVPIGIPKRPFTQASRAARAAAAAVPYGDDIVVQGSRVRGYSLEWDNGVLQPVLKGVPPVGPVTDVDVAIRVDPAAFDAAVTRSFGTPTPGTAKEATKNTAIAQERIFGGDARPNLRGVRRAIAAELGMPENQVQVTLVKLGGGFDSVPSIPIR